MGGAEPIPVRVKQPHVVELRWAQLFAGQFFIVFFKPVEIHCVGRTVVERKRIKGYLSPLPFQILNGFRRSFPVG